MKYVNLFFGILAVTFITACIQRPANRIQGTWQLVEGKYNAPDTTLQYHKNKHMKIIGKNHFSTVWQDTSTQGYSGFNGGTYSFNNGLYIEHIDYSERGIGGRAIFKVNFKADTMIFTPATKEGKEKEYGSFEKWKRLE
ncbi:MAG: hypothetical protein KGY69_14865 [Bacteroidales bacterium]|nr:hypothetical protein [Bacteroidales bacterium]